MSERKSKFNDDGSSGFMTDMHMLIGSLEYLSRGSNTFLQWKREWARRGAAVEAVVRTLPARGNCVYGISSWDVGSIAECSSGRRDSLGFDGVRLHNHDGHLAGSKMPSNMAMKRPNARVVRDETQNGVRVTRDHDCITTRRVGGRESQVGIS